MIKKWSLLILIFIVLICFGCSSGNNYFDTHLVMKQSIQDMIATDDFADKYIIMKTKYMEEIINQSEKLGSIEDIIFSGEENIEFKEWQIATTLYYERLYSFANSYLSLDREQKVKDYYRSIIAMEVTKDEMPDWIKFAEENVGYSLVEITSEEVVLNVYEGVSISLNIIIQNTADALGMTFEECLEDVYSQYELMEAATEFNQMQYLTHLYDGEKIEYNGENEEEYVEYLINVFVGYDEYIDQLVDELDI